MGVFGGGSVFIEEGHVTAFDDEFRGAVNAQDRLLSIGIIGEHKGIATDIGRDIDAGFKQTVFPEEQVFVGVQPHDRQGGLVFTHEDDGTCQGRQTELCHRQGDGMPRPSKTKGAIHALDAQTLVQFQGQGLGLGIEQDIAGDLTVDFVFVRHDVPLSWGASMRLRGQALGPSRDDRASS